MNDKAVITHVIFDLDGLLIESGKCYDKMDEVIIGRYGKEVPHDLKIQCLGLSDIACARLIIKLCDLPVTPEDYEKEINTCLYLLRDSQLLPGADRLVKHLAAHNIPIAVATSSSMMSVNEKMANYRNLLDLFHHVVTASSDPEIKHGKPAPDVFLACAKRFENPPKPEQCLIFEDAPTGVEAAHAAGMRVVMVPDPRLEHPEQWKPTLLIKSLLDFKPEMFGLPPFPE